jgi:hypothetical protein
MPERDLFLVRLSYPLEAMENIEGVVSFDLEKHIPVSVQSVRYFYALNVDQPQNRVDVDVAVMKSQDFDVMNQVLGRFSHRGLLCTTAKFYRKYGKQINFLEAESGSSWRSWLRLSNLHLAFNVLLLAILIAMPVAMLRQGIAAIGEVSPAELKRVTEIVSSINGINVETRYGGQLSEQLGKAPKTVQLLKVLSGNINDGAWLDRFSFKGDEISLRGEADSATSVSDELSRTELFSSIKFVSSIRKNPKTGKESFELLLRLKPDA